MPRPEQQGKGKRSDAHKDKHGGEIVEGRHAGGAFAKDNEISKGKRISQAMRMRNTLRETIGEDGIRECTLALLDLVKDSPDPKDKIAAAKVLFDFAIGKSSMAGALEVTSDAQGNQTVRFVAVDNNGEEQEL